MGLDEDYQNIEINGDETIPRFCAIIRYTLNSFLYILKNQHQKNIKGIKEIFFFFNVVQEQN